MPKIIIQRSAEPMNYLRNYEIYMNNTLIGKIGNGEVKSFDVPAGTHEIYAKIDWCSSPKLTVTGQKDDTLHLTISANKKLSKYTILGIVFALLYIIADLIFQWPGTSVLAIPVLFFFLIFLNFLTFSRKKYLNIENKVLQSPTLVKVH